MFRKEKKVKKRTLEFHRKIAGGGQESRRTQAISSDEIIDKLMGIREEYGPILVEYITDEEISVTPETSREREKEEDRIAEIKQIVSNYVKGRAVEMDAFAVSTKDQGLQGVYGKKIFAESQKRKLIRSGVPQEDVQIQEIQVNGCI